MLEQLPKSITPKKTPTVLLFVLIGAETTKTGFPEPLLLITSETVISPKSESLK